MRELKNNEIYDVSGAVWWSPSNIMGTIHDLFHTPGGTKPGYTSGNDVTSDSQHIGKVIGIGVVVAAGLIAATAAAAVTAAAIGMSVVATGVGIAGIAASNIYK